MKVRFWGTRGSVATPGPGTARYGGNTACIQVTTDARSTLILDCGTGARELGLSLRDVVPVGSQLHILIGHTHWDHIQGFPFFLPSLLSDYRVAVYAPAGFEQSLEEAITGQMQYSYFPVRLRELTGQIEFTELEEGTFRLDDVIVQTQYLNHTAPTLGYRISADGATLVYSADHEPFWDPADLRLAHPGDRRHAEFLTDADLVIHDAQYTLAEYQSKVSWGHSPVEYAVAVARLANVRRLALFHHDPQHDDSFLDDVVRNLAGGPDRLEVFAAAEGQEIVLPRQFRPAEADPDASALGRRILAGARVVVADPDSEEVQWIASILAEEGLKVSSVQDAEGALAMARVLRPDVLVVDASLRTDAGRPLIEAFRSNTITQRVPILLLIPRDTADSDRIADWSSADLTDCFAKPFSSPMLRSRVRAWLARTADLIDRHRRHVAPPAAHAPAEPPPARRRGALARIADRSEFLGTITIFETLSPVERWQVAARLGERIFPAGTEIVVEGEPGDALYVIRSGYVRVTGRASGVRSIEAQLSALGPGQIFGEMALLDGMPRSASVVAVRRTRCLVLSQADFLGLIQRSPDFGLALLRIQATRLRQADRHLAREAPDSLTGLAGRQALEVGYTRMAASARRRGTGLGLLMIDVDDLKLVNDGHGHLAGDEVLSRVAAAISLAARTSDLAGRWGGDEFVVILPDCGADGALLVASRVRRLLQDLPPDRTVPGPITVSIGSTWTSDPPLELNDLLTVADQAMYVEKRRRRQPVGIEIL